MPGDFPDVVNWAEVFIAIVVEALAVRHAFGVEILAIWTLHFQYAYWPEFLWETDLCREKLQG